MDCLFVRSFVRLLVDLILIWLRQCCAANAIIIAVHYAFSIRVHSHNGNDIWIHLNRRSSAYVVWENEDICESVIYFIWWCKGCIQLSVDTLRKNLVSIWITYTIESDCMVSINNHYLLFESVEQEKKRDTNTIWWLNMSRHLNIRGESVFQHLSLFGSNASRTTPYIM